MTRYIEVLDVAPVTHDVVRIVAEKPAGYRYEPGQATDVAVDRKGWRQETRPFTFTSLNAADHLEFVIKVYADHDGVTRQVGSLKAGDRLLIGDPWGAIRYKGRGVFVAGGAGITPFIAILRQLRADGALAGNRLIFSNKTERDIILRDELEAAEGLDCLFTVTDQPGSALARGLVDREFLKRHVQDFGQAFYVCGPPPMVDSVTADLKSLGADPDTVVIED